MNFMLLPPPSASCEKFELGIETDGAAAGWEKLKPRLLGFTREKREPPEVPLSTVLDVPKSSEAEDTFRVGGSGLTLKMGLKTASLGGLKLNWDPMPLVGLSGLPPPEELDVTVGTGREEN